MTGRALDGAAAITAVATGAASVSSVVTDCLDRVRERDEEIGAFRVIDEQAVRSTAKQLDDRAGGLLRGLVVGVKDVIDTADLPTAYGSPLFDGHQPVADAAVVAALRRAGALVLGKTESTEFAMFQPTRTRNPANPGRTPGGSSSGSAAAVAAGMVPVALGTQTAGSVVRPAAYCGIYGFKPSKGWTSTEGVWRLSEELDTIGLFARRAADLLVAYQALQGQTAAARTPLAAWGGTSPGNSPLAGTRNVPAVAVLGGEEWGPCDQDVRDAIRFTADRLATAGWQVREMAMPAAWRHLPDHHAVVMAVEVARNLHGALSGRVGQISESAQAVVERGDRCTASEYLGALDAREEARKVLAPLSVGADLLLTPSALGVAPEGLAFTGDPVMCRAWTLLGLPAANVPAFRRRDGLPVGVQLVGLGTDDLSFLTHLASAEAVLTHKEN